MYRLLIIIFAFLVVKSGISQTEITWETLTDVTFTDKYIEIVDANYYYPTFGAKVKALEGKDVYLTGFILALDPTDNYYILSRNPYASCFFCGSGGPESIVELKLKPSSQSFRMDEIVTIKGRLKLNADDIYQCNYIFEEAEVYSE